MSLNWKQAVGVSSVLALGIVAMNCGGSDTGNSGGAGGTGGSTATNIGVGGNDTSTGTNAGGSTFATGGSGQGGLGTGGNPATGGGSATGGASGTGGSMSSGGGSTSTGGGGSGGGQMATLIQDLEDGTVGMGVAVTVEKVFVTSVRATTNADLTLQEPQGVTKSGVTYPAFAGVALHASPTEVTTYNIATIAVGDCISVSATTSEFHSNTELNTITAFAKVTGCGTAPTPMDVDTAQPVHFGDIATDAGGMMAGAQAETYENVLLRIHNVTVTPASSATGFFVIPTGQQSTTPNLLIDNFITGPITPAASYTTITGVLEQFDTFSLYPRTMSDLVP